MGMCFRCGNSLTGNMEINAWSYTLLIYRLVYILLIYRLIYILLIYRLIFILLIYRLILWKTNSKSEAGKVWSDVKNYLLINISIHKLKQRNFIKCHKKCMKYKLSVADLSFIKNLEDFPMIKGLLLKKLKWTFIHNSISTGLGLYPLHWH